ncbi:leukocyte immunoglobulin-like receptor subfamily A member 5 [Arvicola amphibius]|uniref:leukocyte immunoglobulin-like receptor subfamily A member 5 n=1 Tax=Arvicola amphibius TaxID=1047088 RepID=UPI001C0800D7|nr:leukocyte immunoglobulin-like receptor subfamily A member 5 [Arvicola amphibius]
MCSSSSDQALWPSSCTQLQPQRNYAMTFTFAVLLCFGEMRRVGGNTVIQKGLFAQPKTFPAERVLPKPTIKAEPGSLVTRGMQVNISCMGTSDAQKHLLFLKKFKNVQHRQSSTIRGEKAVFSINSIGQYDGGQYYCFYETPSGWSAQSDKLELVVTGIFENKPCLSVLPRRVVTSGDNVTFKCFSQEEYDRFIVIKEGEQKHSMIMESQKTSSGQFQALFFVGPMTSSCSGTFKCYGYYKANPYVWSEPSDHLEIQVSGSAMNIKPSKDASKAKTASDTQDYTVENLIRMGLAGLVLIILGTLLFEGWHNQSWTYHEAGK